MNSVDTTQTSAQITDISSPSEIRNSTLGNFRRTARRTVLGATAASMLLGLTAGSAIAAPTPTLPSDPVISIGNPASIPVISVPLGTLPPLTVPPVTLVPINPALFLTFLTASGPAAPVNSGDPVAYKVVVSKGSLALNSNVQLLHSVPAAVNGAVWSCAPTGGATCGGSAAGSGNIARNLSMPAGSSVTFLINGTVVAGSSSFNAAFSATNGGSNLASSAAINVNAPATTSTVPPTVPPTPAPAPAPAPTAPVTTLPAATPVPSTPAPSTGAAQAGAATSTSGGTATPTTQAKSTKQPTKKSTKKVVKKTTKKAKKVQKKVKKTTKPSTAKKAKSSSTSK